MEITEGCKRLASALDQLAEAWGLPKLDAGAIPYGFGEAAVFLVYNDDEWANVHGFLLDVAGWANPEFVTVRVGAEDGQRLVYAVVSLTEAAAVELAAELEKCAAWRREGSP